MNIADRLRAYVSACKLTGNSGSPHAGDCQEAVDELERCWEELNCLMDSLGDALSYLEGDPQYANAKAGIVANLNAMIVRETPRKLGTGSESAPGLAQSDTPSPARQESDGL